MGSACCKDVFHEKYAEKRREKLKEKREAAATEAKAEFERVATKPKDIPELALVEGVVWVGTRWHLHCQEDYEGLGCPAVLDLTHGPANKFARSATYHQIQILDRDEEPIILHFDEAIKFMDEAIAQDGRVLVYCRDGVSIAPTICAAWLMKRHHSDGMDPSAALDVIREKHKICDPNSGFRAQLQEYCDRECSYKGVELAKPRGGKRYTHKEYAAKYGLDKLEGGQRLPGRLG